VVFGPTPRSFTVKVNRKARRAALRSALSAHAERGSLAVFDAAAFEAPSTKQAASLLTEWNPATGPTLVLLAEAEAAASKSFRNVSRVAVMAVEEVGVADVIGAAALLVSEAALGDLVARASGFTGTEAATEAGREPGRSSEAGRRAPSSKRGAGSPAEETP
jgi:large subunit ribosomal protein L4